MDWHVLSSVLGNETQGTNLSSVYAGDFSRCVIGMRPDLDIRVLNERYADLGQIGLWSYTRFSIRFAHPVELRAHHRASHHLT